MTANLKTKENPWLMDVRVRERNLKSGALTDKDLEKNLAAIPDVADQAEPFATPQPALAQPPAPPPPVSEPDDVDDEDEDDDIDDEDDNDSDEPEAAPEGAAEEPAATGGEGEGTGEP